MNYGQAYSPPCQGGVAAPSTKWSRSEEARTGWSITSYVSQCVLQRVVWLTILYVSRCRAHAPRPSAAPLGGGWATCLTVTRSHSLQPASPKTKRFPFVRL